MKSSDRIVRTVRLRMGKTQVGTPPQYLTRPVYKLVVVVPAGSVRDSET